jgi:hypothetical protein
MAFAEQFGRDDEDADDILQDADSEEAALQNIQPSLIDRISESLYATQGPDQEGITQLNKETERMLKMFYLEMRVKGNLNENKNDYFA